jgi:hypothetical protein
MLVAMSALLAWILRAPRDLNDSPPDNRVDDIDYEQLREAEEEVQDLDTFTSPDDADEELRDWGPGTPR